MKTAALALTLMTCTLLLAGCSADAKSDLCSIVTPSPVDSPTTQNNQRVEAQTGPQATGGAPQQNCP